MTRILSALAAMLFLPSVASAFGGAGVSLQHVQIGETRDNYAGGDDVEAPDSLDCIGLNGGGNLKLLRLGAEVYGCAALRDRSPGGSWMITAGPNVGIQWGYHVYGFSTVTLGGGAQTFATAGGNRLSTVFGFAKPSIGVGVPVGLVAFELSGWLMAPVNLASVLHQNCNTPDCDELVEAKGGIPTSVGLQVSMLWGDYRKNRGAPTDDEVWEYAEPPAVSVPPPPPQPVAAVGSPLAVPAGSVPPPPPRTPPVQTASGGWAYPGPATGPAYDPNARPGWQAHPTAATPLPAVPVAPPIAAAPVVPLALPAAQTPPAPVIPSAVAPTRSTTERPSKPANSTLRAQPAAQAHPSEPDGFPVFDGGGVDELDL